MPLDTIEYWVTDAYAVYLMTADSGDLSDEDIRDLNAFDLDASPSAYQYKHWDQSYDPYGEPIHSYRRCEVSGLTARCLKMLLNVRNS